MIQPETRPPRKMGPFRLALTCGCIWLVIAGMLFGAATWVMNRAVVSDPAQVVALADQILPGAKPLPGQVGIAGLQMMGRRLAILGDPIVEKPQPGSEGNLIVLQSLDPDAKPEEVTRRLRTELEDRGYRAEAAVAEEGTVTIAGREALRSVLKTSDGKTIEQFAVVFPGRAVALFQGPMGEDGVRAFLEGLAPEPTAVPSP